jgi:hypothetical protein
VRGNPLAPHLVLSAQIIGPTSIWTHSIAVDRRERDAEDLLTADWKPIDRPAAKMPTVAFSRRRAPISTLSVLPVRRIC